MKVISEPNGNDKDMYKIRWSVESYSEPTQYKILYRKVQVSKPVFTLNRNVDFERKIFVHHVLIARLPRDIPTHV